MGKTVIGEMFMIWLAWKVMNVVINFIALKLPLPQALQNVLTSS